MALSKPVKQIVDESTNPLLVKHDSWQRVSIGEIAKIENGYAFKSKAFNKQGEGMPLIRIRDVTKGETETYFDGEYEDAYIVNSGDLLIGMDGDFNSARWSGRPALLNQRVCRIRLVSDFYDESFLALALQPYLDEINKETSSVTVKHLSSKTVSEIPLPLPPLPEQRRIVARIEELFSRLDAGVAALRQAKAQLKRYRQSVLAAAVTGELTREWREQKVAEASRLRSSDKDQRQDASATLPYESAEELLKRILKQRREQWSGRGKYKEPKSKEAKLEIMIPSNWIQISLDQCCLKITDGTHHSPPNQTNGEFKYLTSKNVREFKLLLEKVNYVTEKVHREIYARCDVKPNDVLYVKDGVNTGLAAKNTLEEEFSLLSSVGVFRPVKEVQPDYLVIFLNSEIARRSMLSKVAGVAITRLTLSKLKVATVILPPLPEQHQIVAEVEARTTAIDHLEAELDRQITRSNRLRQSALAAAFSGRL